MRREPTLADLLADETGNLRPEVAEMLMRPATRRRPPQQRRRAQPPPRPRLWPYYVAAGIFVLILLNLLSECQGYGQLAAVRHETVPYTKSYKTTHEPPVQPAAMTAEAERFPGIPTYVKTKLKRTLYAGTVRPRRPCGCPCRRIRSQ